MFSFCGPTAILQVKPFFSRMGRTEFFSGARIGSRFQDYQLALLQIGLNGEGGLLDVAQVRFTTFIEGSWDADDNGVAFFQLLEIGGGAEMFAIHKLLNLGLLDVLDVRFAGVEHGETFLEIGIETRNSVPGFRKAQRQRQSHIAAANDAYFKLGAFKKFGFPVDWHEFVVFLV